mmetsp:Transcript_24142/g.28434  ORF Transcript_24142/g.28434 Transcript_24142/m.28434 type:complete len:449 (+) Transcript_24142:186-1532(+)|eukprot:CAMPEP_0198257282 /NCGR_PEP_ID=MMETSP1447-20131203/7007_1 /TAXON_ID=420782 /ORGANISM="Chaetoceros dichaeta, Strain CCMP1751" /LENGTH=448 /DNA_ID=CAMNT_0043944153 /DNA_START=146 /DNA_END=1492 /DNA_ORIENTATION=+
MATKLHGDSQYIPMDAREEEKKKQPSWNKLKKMEMLRRSVLLRAELPFWRVLLFWRGTCLKELVLDPFVWTVFAIYAGIRIKARLLDGAPDETEVMATMSIDILGGFLSFFLVLFVNQTQTRFLTMYGFSKACSGRIQDVAGLVKVQFPAQLGRRLVRHINAAHVAGYVGLNGIGMPKAYSKLHFFGHYNRNNQLITPEEMKRIDPLLMESGGAVMKELVTWCQEDVGIAKKSGHIDSYEANMIHERILEFRASMDSIYDYTDQPPHFFYIHFLAILAFVYLPLFAVNTAYNTGWGDDDNMFMDVLNGLIVLLQCIFVLGLRSLGTKMIDPYGSDLEDLSVIHYVDATLDTCNIIMTSKQVVPDCKQVDPDSIFYGASVRYDMATVMDEDSRLRILQGTSEDGSVLQSNTILKNSIRQDSSGDGSVLQSMFSNPSNSETDDETDSGSA